MTKNADKPAYPSGEAYRSQSIPGGDWVECKKGALHNGLTKREMFAMAAIQGLCAHSGDYHTFSDMASGDVILFFPVLRAVRRHN